MNSGLKISIRAKVCAALVALVITLVNFGAIANSSKKLEEWASHFAWHRS